MIRTQAIIHLSALVHNFQEVQKKSVNQKIIAMVKANAYGHGLLEIAQALPESCTLGVATLEEALFLRKIHQLKNPIVLMPGFLSQDQFEIVLSHHIAPVIHSESQLVILESSVKKIDSIFADSPKIWLKIDTGMHRLGFSLQEFPAIFHRAKHCFKTPDAIGLMTHLAEADIENSAATKNQLIVFKNCTQGLNGPTSVANSAAIISQLATQTQFVRPGIMLYGASPFANHSATSLNLRPVMTLQSRLMAMKTLEKGAKIGYGGTFTCPEEMPVGVVSIGYGDGYPRHIEENTPVLVNGIRCPIVGRVSMDMLTVDLRLAKNAKVGNTVTLWGEGLPVEEIATKARSISYELFCQLTKRVVMHYEK